MIYRRSYRVFMDTNARFIENLAADIDRSGIAAVEPTISAVVEHARSAGVNPVLLSVLADASEPEVARARAFGLVATHLARAAGAPPSDEPTLALAV